MNISERSTARQIITTLQDSGAKIPKPVDAAWQRTVRMSEALQAMPYPGDELPVAVAAAIEAGRDPSADAEVQRLLTGQQIAGNQGIMQSVEAIGYEQFQQVCREQADAIVQALRIPFDQAATALAEAHGRIGNAPLGDTDAIVRQGGDAAATWAKATAAAATVDQIVNGWTTLATFTRLVQLDPRYSALRLAAVTYETWMSSELQHRRLTPWEAATSELSLSLPTITEYRARIAAIEAGHALAAQQAEAAMKDQLRTFRPMRASA